MKALINFSLRIPKDLTHQLVAEAKRSGLSRSEYARRAIEAYQQQQMQNRMAEISVQLAAHSAAASEAMDASVSDALV